MKKLTNGSTRVLLLSALGISVVGGIMSGHVKEHELDSNNDVGLLTHQGELTIGLEGTYAPFSYKNKVGDLVGYDVDTAKAVAEKMGLKAVFVQTKFDSLVGGLDAKKYDVVFNDLSATKERKDHYTFAKPYLVSKPVMIVQKDSDIKDLSDLKGKRSAQTTSSNYAQSAKDAGADIVSVPGFSEALDLVSSGSHADVTLNAEDAWSVYQKQHPKTNLNAVPIRGMVDMRAEPMLNKKNVKLTQQISDAETKLQKSGELSTISEKYFGKDLSGSREIRK
ncbi:transporter substrate-binding domain-containing protein [Weissella minor]|uniref:transporter substrate-binding domain-containing protein n=1 Tax=Weissella minor TaxID=1620 RepID=UPI003AF28F58